MSKRHLEECGDSGSGKSSIRKLKEKRQRRSSENGELSPASEKLVVESDLKQQFYESASEDGSIEQTVDDEDQNNEGSVHDSVSTADEKSNSSYDAEDNSQEHQQCSDAYSTSLIIGESLLQEPNDSPKCESQIIFETRCKLYRYDKQARQNKERGVGNIQVLHYSENFESGVDRYRVLMLRDQTHQVCADFPLFYDFKVQQLSDTPNVYQWACTDFSEDSVGIDGVVFTARFRNEMIAQEFANILDQVASLLPKPTEEQISAAAAARAEAKRQLSSAKIVTDVDGHLPSLSASNADSSAATNSDEGASSQPSSSSSAPFVFGSKVASRTLSFASFTAKGDNKITFLSSSTNSDESASNCATVNSLKEQQKMKVEDKKTDGEKLPF